MDDNDSNIIFEKAENQKEEEDDSLPERTTAIDKQKRLSPNRVEVKKKNEENKRKTKGLDDKNELAEELRNMENNSGLIDSSVEMIEGLVKGMTGRPIKLDDRKVFN